ncbi:pro-resilin-like [Macrobrachium nipponense]|uniref:pro-resilin-like n=1 Tax=Macrobrachium nipponense TaxID=159736 RepID=UPI0030C89DF4
MCDEATPPSGPNKSLLLCSVIKITACLIAFFSSTLSHPNPEYASKALPYNFHYDINDQYQGLRYGRKEKSSGNAVYGSYTILLPDGRKQHVEYRADGRRGFVATVTYEGEAHHPKMFGPAITFKPSFGNGDRGYGRSSHGFSLDENGSGQIGNGSGRNQSARDANGFGYGNHGGAEGDNRHQRIDQGRNRQGYMGAKGSQVA